MKENTIGMKKIMVIVLAIGIFSSGCVIFKKPIPTTEKGAAEDTRGRPVVSDAFLTDRIRGLSDRIDEYRTLMRDLKREEEENSEALSLLQNIHRHAEDLRKTYRDLQKLQRMLLKAKSYNRERTTYRSMIDGLLRELTRLEQGYFDDEQAGVSAREKVIKGYLGALKEIEEYCTEGDSLRIVESYQDVKKRYGEFVIPVNIKLCYAEALSNTDHLGEAVEITEGVISHESSDSISLYSNLIDWYLQMEYREKALKNFEKLSKELDRNMAAFLISRSRITSPLPRETEHSAKKMFGNEIVEQDIKPVEDKSKDPSAQGHVKKDKVVKDGMKRRHRQEEGYPHEMSGGTSSSTVGSTYRGPSEIPVKSTEDLQSHRKQKKGENDREVFVQDDEATQENMEKEKFMMAKVLMESGKYEEAVNELIELKDGEKYGRESEEMIQRSIDEFARQKRETAAKLFLLAKRTTDTKEKKEMLLKSFESLQEVIRKYPTSTYSGKIIKNIETVKEEILKIDPMFSGERSRPDQAIIK